MKLEKWALVAEVISGTAIVISLVILIFEVRGNTDAVQAQSSASRLESDRARRYPLIVNEGGLTEAILKRNNGEQLSEVEQFQVAMYYRDVLDALRWQFAEAQAGRLSEMPVRRLAGFRAGNQPGLDEEFDRQRPTMDPEFIRFWEDNFINVNE